MTDSYWTVRATYDDGHYHETHHNLTADTMCGIKAALILADIIGGITVTVTAHHDHDMLHACPGVTAQDEALCPPDGGCHSFDATAIQAARRRHPAGRARIAALAAAN